MSKRPRTWADDSVNKRRRVTPRVMTVPATKAVADAIMKDVNARTGGFLGKEIKFKDLSLAGQDMVATWTGAELDPATALSVSVVAQGDGESERDGREYLIHSVHITGFIHQPAEESANTPASDLLVRLALVWDTQTNGAQLNAEDVYRVEATSDQNGFRNLQYTKRFIVLKDKRFRVPVSASVLNEGGINLFALGQVNFPFKFNKRFKTPIKVRCSGTTAVVGGVTDNSLHLIGCYSSANAVAPKITYDSRIRFSG